MTRERERELLRQRETRAAWTGAVLLLVVPGMCGVIAALTRVPL